MHVEIEVLGMSAEDWTAQQFLGKTWLRTPTEKGNEKDSRFVLPEKNQNLLRSIRVKEKHYREK